MCAVNSIAASHRIDGKLRYYVNQWNKTCDRRNKITERNALVIQAYLSSPNNKIRNNKSRAYMSIYTEIGVKSARVNSSKLFMKPKIIDTIEKTLAEEGVTKRSALREQLDIIDGAKKSNQWSAAGTANKPILEMVGLIRDEKTINVNHNVDFKNLDGLSNKEISEKLDALLGMDVNDIIEGEFEEIEEPELLETEKAIPVV